jgi:hypothetical protein
MKNPFSRDPRLLFQSIVAIRLAAAACIAVAVFGSLPARSQMCGPMGDSSKAPPGQIDEVTKATVRKNCTDYGAGKIPECSSVCPEDSSPGRDDDFARNCGEIVTHHLIYEPIQFEEGSQSWLLQILKNPEKPDGPLWFVPHDNENVAFDTAIYGLVKYGGALIAVETGGYRENMGEDKKCQDPNRNFDIGKGPLCPLQRSHSPRFTKEILERWNRRDPIIALHSNTPGGSISIERAPKPAERYPGKTAAVPPNRKLLFAPDDTLVFVAPIEGSKRVTAFKDALNAGGVNVLREHVDLKRNDCSLSNYAALNKIENYFNVEVAHSHERGSVSERAQQAIVDIIMKLPGLRN